MLIAQPKLRLPEASRLTEKERWQATKAYRDPKRVGRWFTKDGAPVTETAKAQAASVVTRTELKRQRAAAKALRRQVAKELKRGVPP